MQVFSASPSPPDRAIHVPLSVAHVERLGHDAIAYGHVGGSRIAARIQPQDLRRPGDMLRLTVDFGALHFFDEENGMRLCMDRT